MKADFEKITNEIKEALGGNLISLVLYGSHARNEASDKSDINLFIVVDDSRPQALQGLSKLVSGWSKQHIAVPVIFEHRQLSRSHDSFALEFIEMAAARKTLFGDDLFKDYKPDWETLRRELEREARQKRIVLLRRYLMAGDNSKAYLPIIRETVPGYFTLLRCTVMVMGKSVQTLSFEATMSALSDRKWFKADVWRKLHAISKGNDKPSSSEISALFQAYLEQADEVVKALDEM